MKHIQFFFFFIVLFIASVNTYAQSPDRVLSAEEFRQRIIEEKRQQLKQMIQVEANDRMRYGYFAGQINVYVFLANTYSFHEQIQAIEGKNNELNAIMKACSDEIKKMFFDEVKDFFFPYLKDKSLLKKYRNPDWDKLKIKYNIFLNRFLDTFNEFLAASPENREKVAQAIRDYRLAEFIKDVLPDVESERNITTGNFRFIGFTIGIGLAKSYSDKYDYYAPVSSGDHSVIPIFNVDANFRYMNLYRINSDFHIGFIVDFGIWCEFIGNSIQFLGSDLMLGMKFERLLVGIGGYIYFRVSKWDNDNSIVTQLKTIDTGLMFSFNYLLGTRMNYLLGLDIRVNLNKFVIHKSDEVGHVSILFKFGYGF